LADVAGSVARPAHLPSGDLLRISSYLSRELGAQVYPSEVARAKDFRDLVASVVNGRGPAEPGPLSHAQSRFVLAELTAPLTPDNSIMLAFRLDGVLDVDAWRAAVADVVRHHLSLRTRFGSGVDGMSQWVGAEADPPLEVDLTASVAETAEVGAEWWAEPIDLWSSPPFRARLCRYGRDGHLLLLNFHHVAADGHSLSIVWRDLVTSYRARSAGAAPELPATLSYQHYVDWETVQLDRWMSRDLPYWRGLLAGWHSDGTGAEAGLVGARSEWSVVLSAAEASQVSSSARSRGGTLLTALTYSASQALFHVAGVSRLMFATMSSGRLEREFDSTVGCFVNTIVLPLTARDASIEVTNEVVLNGLRHGRTPVDEIIRAMGGRESVGPIDAWVILQEGAASGWLDRELRYTEVYIPAPATGLGLVFEAVWRGGGSELVLRLLWRTPGIASGLGRQLTETWRDELLALLSGR
jgi:hypothetical protein